MKIRFTQRHQPQQHDGKGPVYEANTVYLFEGPSAESYARKYVERGYAERVSDTAKAMNASDARLAGDDSQKPRAEELPLDPEAKRDGRPKTDAELHAAILAAATGLKSDSDDFTATGLPQVKALETLLGYNITAAERDAAWATRAPA